MFTPHCIQPTLLAVKTVTKSLLLSLMTGIAAPAYSSEPLPGRTLYYIKMDRPADVSDWVMEGPGVTEFKDGWMELFSPQQQMHHVLWSPVDFPDSFIAEWEAQNLNPDAGLVIIFFAATGKGDKDLFDPILQKRDGTFRQYTKGDILSYHISYYANTPSKPARSMTHLRKNSGFNLVSQGSIGIHSASTAIHKIKLAKNGARIKFYVDDKPIIDWTDDNLSFGPYLKAGKIGFRQMKWTRFRYRNFRVSALPPNY